MYTYLKKRIYSHADDRYVPYACGPTCINRLDIADVLEITGLVTGALVIEGNRRGRKEACERER